MLEKLHLKWSDFCQIEDTTKSTKWCLSTELIKQVLKSSV